MLLVDESAAAEPATAPFWLPEELEEALLSPPVPDPLVFVVVLLKAASLSYISRTSRASGDRRLQG